MKTYEKPIMKLERFESKETFADYYDDVFGTGTQIPITVYSYTNGDSSSL